MKILSRFSKPTELAAAEAKVSDLRARAAAAAERQAAVVAQLDEARRALDAAAEAGEELAPRADAIVALEAKVKAAGLEAGPLAAVLGRAESALAELKEEQRRALLDAELEELHAELETERAAAQEAMKVLCRHVETAFGLDRLIEAAYTARNGRAKFETRGLYENGHWALLLEEAAQSRPLLVGPEDEQRRGSLSLKVGLYIVDPQVAARALKARRDAKRAA